MPNVDQKLIETMQQAGELPPAFSHVDPALLTTMLNKGELTFNMRETKGPDGKKGISYGFAPTKKLTAAMENSAAIERNKAEIAGDDPAGQSLWSHWGEAWNAEYGPEGQAVMARGAQVAGDAIATTLWPDQEMMQPDGSTVTIHRGAQDFSRNVVTSGGKLAAATPDMAVQAGKTAVSAMAANQAGRRTAYGQVSAALGDKEAAARQSAADAEYDRLRTEAVEGFRPFAEGLTGGPNGAAAKSFRALGYAARGDHDLARATMGNVVQGIGREAWEDPVNAALIWTGIGGVAHIAEAGVRGTALARARGALLKTAADETVPRDIRTAAAEQADRLQQAQGVYAQWRALVQNKQVTPEQLAGREAMTAEANWNQRSAHTSTIGPTAPPPAASGQYRVTATTAPMPSRPQTTSEPPMPSRPQTTSEPPITPSRLPTPVETPTPEATSARSSIVPNFPARDIQVDPDRFQFKIGYGANGVASSSAVGGAKVYNPLFAGVLDVWRDPADGRTYVVNGHNRLALANRAGAENVDVRFINAETDADARTFGAMKNIAEGHGTPFDAAKLFRDQAITQDELAQYGISLRGQIANQGFALAQLSPELFGAATRGEIPLERAVIIGAKLPNYVDQSALIKLIDKRSKSRPITNETLSELIDAVGSSPKHTTQSESLFGTDELTQNLAVERATVAAHIAGTLKKDATALSGAARNAARIRSVEGNEIRADETADLAQQNLAAVDVFNRLKNSSGPVSDILTQAARRIAAGEKAQNVYAEALEQYRDVAKQYADGGNVDAGYGGPGPGSGGVHSQSEAPTSLFSVDRRTRSLRGQRPTDTADARPHDPHRAEDTVREYEPTAEEIDTYLSQAHVPSSMSAADARAIVRQRLIDERASYADLDDMSRVDNDYGVPRRILANHAPQRLAGKYRSQSDLARHFDSPDQRIQMEALDRYDARRFGGGAGAVMSGLTGKGPRDIRAARMDRTPRGSVRSDAPDALDTPSAPASSTTELNAPIRSLNHAMGTGLPGRVQVDPIPGGKPKPLADIVLDLGKSVGRRVDVGKLPARIGGRYSTDSAATLIRFHGDLDITAHEIAHALDDQFGITAGMDPDKPSPYDAELQPFWDSTHSSVGANMVVKRAEGAAEWIRAYVVNPTEAVRMAPTFAAHVVDTIGETALRKLQAFSDDVRTYAGASAMDQIGANIATHKATTAAENFKTWLNGEGWEFETTGMDRFSALAFDSLHPFEKAIAAARRIQGLDGTTVLPADDPMLLARLHSGNGSKLEDVFDNGMVDSRNERVTEGGLDWLLGTADNSSEAAMKRDIDDAERYMIAERTIERANVNRRDTEAQISADRERISDIRGIRIAETVEQIADAGATRKLAIQKEQEGVLRGRVTEVKKRIRSEATAAAQLSREQARGQARRLEAQRAGLRRQMEAEQRQAEADAIASGRRATDAARAQFDAEAKVHQAVAEAIHHERNRRERIEREREERSGKPTVSGARKTAIDPDATDARLLRGSRTVGHVETAAARKRQQSIAEAAEVLRDTHDRRFGSLEEHVAQETAYKVSQARKAVAARYDERLRRLGTRIDAAKEAAGDMARQDIDAKIRAEVDAMTLETAREIKRRQDLVDDATAGRIMKAVKKTVEHYDDLIEARAQWRRARVERRNERITGIGGGLTPDEKVARRALEEMRSAPERLAKAKEAARRYREWADALLHYQVDKGLISKESYDAIKDRNEYYVALARDVEETGPRRGQGGRLGTGRKTIHTFEGSTRTIKDPYQTLLDATHDAIREADRNEVMLKFRELLMSDRGLHQGKVRNLASIGRKAAEGDERTIKIMVKGKAEYWQFEEGLYNALKGFTTDTPMLPVALTFMSALMREAVTHFPAFLARNVVRDTIERTLKSDVGSGFRDMGRWTPEQIAQFRLSGGDQAGYYIKSQNNYNKALSAAMSELSRDPKTILVRAPGNFVRQYQRLARGSELVNRMAEYKAAYRTAKARGYDDYNAQLFAASHARGLMDFAVAGEWGRKINQIIPFTNAAVQGGRSLFRFARNNPGKFAVRWSTMVLAPTIGMWMLNKANGNLDEYRQLPPYLRDFFWNFKIGPDHWVRIPKGYEVAVFAGGVERAIDKAEGNQNAFEGWGGDFMRSFLPVDQSALAGPWHALWDTISNYDSFRQRTIVPPYEDKLKLGSRKGVTHASGLGQALGAVFNVDSRKADYFIGDQFGGFGQFATSRNLTDAGRRLTGFETGSPAYGSTDVQAVMRLAEQNGMRDPLSALLKDYFAEKTPEGRDAAARRLRSVAHELRPKYEDLDKR